MTQNIPYTIKTIKLTAISHVMQPEVRAP